jgi:porphobilinogen synthase
MNPRLDRTLTATCGAPSLSHASFPGVRMRRNRRANWSRRLVAEHMLSPSDLIWPLFVIEGRNKRVPVVSMPGVERVSVDLAVQAAEEALELGIPAMALFPYTDPELRTEDAREALNPDNLVCRATRAVKDAGLDIGVILDVALDPYTSHGHDGLMRDG